MLLQEDIIKLAANISTLKECILTIDLLAFLIGANSSRTIQELDNRTTNQIQIQEAHCFYGFQRMRDNIHLETFCDILEKCQALDWEMSSKINTGLQKKLEWVLEKTSHQENTLSERLLALAVFRGILQAGALATIGWLSRNNGMFKFASTMERIMQDHVSDTEFSSLLSNYIDLKIPPSSAENTINEALAIEREFVQSLGNKSCLSKYQVIDFIQGSMIDVALILDPIYATANKLLVGFQKPVIQKRI